MMAIDPIWFTIEQTKRILEPMGWKLVMTDTSGDMIRITLEKEKPKPA